MSEIKVGGRVAVYYSGIFDSVIEVLRITPKGTIRCTNKRSYSKDGREIGGDPMSRGDIKPWEQKHSDIMELDQIAEIIRKVRFEKLSLPQLRELKALLEKFTAENL